MVVTPMEVVKIRLQAQQHSLADPLEAPRYRNAGHAVYKIVREEGFSTLYRGVTLTALRQATNQGASYLFSSTPFYQLRLGTDEGFHDTLPPPRLVLYLLPGFYWAEADMIILRRHRGELHRIPGAEEVCAQLAAGADGPAVVPAHVHRPDFGRDGPVLERPHRYH